MAEKKMAAAAALLLLLAASGGPAAAAAAELAVCPGEGARYEDFKCNHDVTHRVCAQLLNTAGQPQSWGPQGTFWQITGQEAWQWDQEIRDNQGDSWCICMWATARLIEAAGCENVHIRCDATDVAFVMGHYSDAGTDLAPARRCLAEKCPAQAVQVGELVPLQASDASLPAMGLGSIAATLSGAPGLRAAACAVSVAGALFGAALGGYRLAAARRQQQAAGCEPSCPEAGSAE